MAVTIYSDAPIAGISWQKRQVMLVSFICYAFNLTLSTWVAVSVCATASIRASV